MALFGKRLSPYYGKNRSNKQRETTVHHSFKTRRSVNVESFFSAVANIKLYDETGSHEDHHRIGRPRVTSVAEDMFIRVTSLRKCSSNKCSSNRHISTSTAYVRTPSRLLEKHSR